MVLDVPDTRVASSIMSQSLHLSDGLERINTQDLLPFQETSEIIAIVTGFADEMNGEMHSHHHHHHHQLQHQHSYYTPNVDHFNSTPCLEDLDTEFKFEVEVPMDEKEKKLWFYDATTKRLFVKGDQSLTAFVSCRMAQSNLYVRLMPVYTSLADVRKPVYRCPNHKDQCKSVHREHIVHCHNEGAVYKGAENGETFGERLSILVPMRKSMQQSTQDAIREEIVFSFTCLNSCSGISRRPTALIFTLENEHMEILGRTVMNFRACTSPKRDFDNDRKKRGVPPSVDDAGPSAKRPMIVKNADGTTTALVKIEQQESSQDWEPSSPSTVECLLSLALPDKETALKILHYTQDYLSGEVTRGRPVNKKYFKQISKQIDEVTK